MHIIPCSDSWSLECRFTKPRAPTNLVFPSRVNKRSAAPLERAMTLAFLDHKARAGKLKQVPIDQTPQRSRVFAIDAGSLGFPHAGVGREERKGLPRLFGFVVFVRPALHCETPKIAGTGDHMEAGVRPYVTAFTLSFAMRRTGPRIGKRSLKSWTDGSLIVDSRIDLLLPWRGRAAPGSGNLAPLPRSITTQKMARHVKSDFQATAPEHLVLDAAGAPAWAACGSLRKPLGDLDPLGLADEGAAWPIERGLDPASCAALAEASSIQS